MSTTPSYHPHTPSHSHLPHWQHPIEVSHLLTTVCTSQRSNSVVVLAKLAFWPFTSMHNGKPCLHRYSMRLFMAGRLWVAAYSIRVRVIYVAILPVPVFQRSPSLLREEIVRTRPRTLVHSGRLCTPGNLSRMTVTCSSKCFPPIR